MLYCLIAYSLFVHFFTDIIKGYSGYRLKNLSHEAIIILFFCLESSLSFENVTALWASTTVDRDCYGLNWFLVPFCLTSVGKEGGGL